MLPKYLIALVVLGVVVVGALATQEDGTAGPAVVPNTAPPIWNLAINDTPPGPEDRRIVSCGPDLPYGAYQHRRDYYLDDRGYSYHDVRLWNCRQRATCTHSHGQSCGGGYGIWGNRCRPFWCRGPLRRIISFPFRRHRC